MSKHLCESHLVDSHPIDINFNLLVKDLSDDFMVHKPLVLGFDFSLERQ